MAIMFPASGKPPDLPAETAPTPRGVSELGSAVVGLAFAGFLTVLLVRNLDHSDSGVLSTAFVVQYSAPGLLALLARWKRPGLYLAAGVVGMIVPFTAMSGVALPLIVPAGMSLVAYGRQAGTARGRLADPVLAVCALFLVIASWGSLFVHQDPYCRGGPNWSECGNDRVTSVEGALFLAFSLAVVVVPFILATPRKPRRSHD